MTDDELKALAIGQAWIAYQRAQRRRQAVLRAPMSTEADRQAVATQEQQAYDQWLEARESV